MTLIQEILNQLSNVNLEEEETSIFEVKDEEIRQGIRSAPTTILEVALKGARNFKACSVVQVKERVESGERFFRIRAPINIRNPIQRMIHLRKEKGSEVGYYQIGEKNRCRSQVEGFRQALADANPSDSGYYGNKYTWARGRSLKERILERLDRGVAYSEWQSRFPNTKIFHLSASWSDHVPIQIIIHNKMGVPMIKAKRKNMQRFEELWTKYDECCIVIRQNWGSWSMNPWENIVLSTKKTLEALKNWGSNKFGI
ncbi:hypothetical protein ACH5RR_018298 [Cinchona calisaya]|uniref:Uncharacterized protein n=1 Tax=Cinchona calisaya TaxID=153742 RepID=A0ABD2ZLL4_9GENT